LIIETQQRRRIVSRKAAAEPRSWTSYVLPVVCWGYLLTILAVWIFLRQEGERWWPATLLMVSPRWPFAVPAALLWLCVISARRWGSALVMTAATAALVGPLLGLRLSLPVGTDERGELRLLSCNIHRQQVNTEQLAAFIGSTQPDVVVLQDWSSAEHDLLFAGPGWHVRRDGQLLIASHFPIARVTSVDFGDRVGSGPDERSAAACYDLQSPTGPIRLINVHLASPHTGMLTFLHDHGQELDENADRRWRESATLRNLVESSTDPVVLAGDFNTTDDSAILREQWADFADAFSERGLGIGYTYLNRHTQLRIDHVLAGPGWQILRCWVGPAVGSPHRPLVADLRVR
jgi:vancomycin resistance protein VanJ